MTATTADHIPHDADYIDLTCPRCLRDVEAMRQRTADPLTVPEDAPWGLRVPSGVPIAKCPEPGCGNSLLGDGTIIHGSDGFHEWVPADARRGVWIGAVLLALLWLAIGLAVGIAIGRAWA